jgi:MFS family permease
MPMMMAMIGSSIVSGQVIARTGKYKLMSIVGLAIGSMGMFLLAGMGPDTDYITVVRNMLLIGVGLGPVMPVYNLVSQAAVRREQLGVVTSLTQFSRSMGGALGTAIFGSLLVSRFQPALDRALPPEVASLPPEQLAAFQNPLALLNPESASLLQASMAQLGPQAAVMYEALLGAVRVALTSSLHDVFLAGACVAGLGVINALFMREVPLRAAPATQPGPVTAAQPSPAAPQPIRDAPARSVPGERSGLPAAESTVRHPRPAPGR